MGMVEEAPLIMASSRVKPAIAATIHNAPARLAAWRVRMAGASCGGIETRSMDGIVQ
ncbi:hypothetical protein D3C76_1667880 [compost metagenome]